MKVDTLRMENTEDRFDPCSIAYNDLGDKLDAQSKRKKGAKKFSPKLLLVTE